MKEKWIENFSRLKRTNNRKQIHYSICLYTFSTLCRDCFSYRSFHSIFSQINCRYNTMRYNISGWKCGKRIRKRLAMNNIKKLLNYLKLNYILHGGLCVCTHTAVSENPSLPYFMSAPCRPIISGKNWGVITIKTASRDAQNRSRGIHRHC